MVPVAAFVIGLEVVAVHNHDRAIGRVAEGARYRRRGGVADDCQGQTLSERALHLSARVKARAAVDRYSVDYHLIRFGLLLFRLDSAVSVKSALSAVK
jgi:hypothetical protein